MRIYLYALVFLLILVLNDQSAMGQSTSGGDSKSVALSIVVSGSYHKHDYDMPLSFWENGPLVFPSAGVIANIPFTFVEGPLGKILSLRTGLRYTRLASGVTFESVNGGQTFSGKFRIGQNLLALPVQFQLNLGKTPVSIFAGPEFGFLLFARKKSETLQPVEFKTSQTEVVSSDLRRFHAALGGGISVRAFSRGQVFVRYNAGLSHAKKDPERTVSSSDWKTSEFEVGLELNLTN